MPFRLWDFFGVVDGRIGTRRPGKLAWMGPVLNQSLVVPTSRYPSISGMWLQRSLSPVCWASANRLQPSTLPLQSLPRAVLFYREGVRLPGGGESKAIRVRPGGSGRYEQFSPRPYLSIHFASSRSLRGPDITLSPFGNPFPFHPLLIFLSPFTFRGLFSLLLTAPFPQCVPRPHRPFFTDPVRSDATF